MKEEYAYYLGNPNLMGRLRWQESNPFNVIFPNDHTETDSDDDAEVELAFIGQISDELFKFTPIGGFRPRSFKSPLSKEKATCVIRCPDMEDYEQEWNFIESNVESIQAMAPGQYRVPKNFWSGRGDQRGIRVCHSLFEEFSGIRPDESDKEGFNTATWPVESFIRDGFNEMAKDHIVKVPRIYTVDGALMNPQDYGMQLPNAIVECVITVEHWKIGTDISSFTPRLVQMCVLRPPVIATSLRRDESHMGPDYLGSPTKKKRS